MIADGLRWPFYSRRRALGVLFGLTGLLAALMVLHGTSGGATEPDAATSSPSPTSTAPGEWLQPTSTPTPTPSPSTTGSHDPLGDTARDFVATFTDRSLVASRWRDRVAALSTPELGAALATADPTRVPVLTGKPRLHLVGRSDAQATVDATYAEGGLRLTLTTTDGEEWLVANVLPVE